jgi:hypothetical protein
LTFDFDYFPLLTLPYAPTDSKIRVQLAGVTYTKRTEWYESCGKTANQKEIKSTLAVAPTHHVNVYVCKTNNLGWASSFPWELPDHSVANGMFL